MLTLLFLALVAMILGVGEICRDLYHDTNLYSSALTADEVNAIVQAKVDDALLPERINAIVRERVMAALTQKAVKDTPCLGEDGAVRLTFDGGALVTKNWALAQRLAAVIEAEGLVVETEPVEEARLALPAWDEEHNVHYWTQY